MKVRIVAVFILSFMFLQARSQSITLFDTRKINIEVKNKMDKYRDLITLLTIADDPRDQAVKSQEKSERIAAALKRDTNVRVFYDAKASVESDGDAGSGMDNIGTITAQDYLQDVADKYVGGADIKIVAISHVKRSSFLFVRVQFTSKFRKMIKNNNPTTEKKRLAILRIDSLGDHQWAANIASIEFFDPSKSIESVDRNITVMVDSSINARPVPAEELANILKQDSVAAATAELRKDQARQRIISRGDSLYRLEQFEAALNMYKSAQASKVSDDVYMDILNTQKAIIDNKFETLKSRGDVETTDHNYTVAIAFYLKAQSKQQPHENLQPKIDLLNQRLAVINLPGRSLQSHDYKTTIKICEDAIDKHKRSKDLNEYPELYYYLGYANQLAAEGGDGSVSDKKVLAYYNLALDAYHTYAQALITRAEYYVKYKSDLNRAISDYDVLVANTRDTVSAKPWYLATKAKWEDKLNLYPEAKKDYSSAIALDNKKDSLFYLRGELIYRYAMAKGSNADFAQVIEDFSSAVKVNSTYATGYYYRGLGYSALKNYDRAGVDFAAAEKNGLAQGYVAKVDSITSGLFNMGQDFYSKNDYVKADTAYLNAIKVKKCNADAWHGLAGVRLTIANAEYDKKQLDKAKEDYLKSVQLNTNAVNCNPTFSDAFFKKGIAEVRLEKYNDAEQSFSDAIKSNSGNIDAYVNRGHVRQILKKYPVAADDYSGALDLLKQLYERTKNNDEQAAIKGQQSMVHLYHGQALYYASDYPNSIKTLDQALDFNKNNAEAFYFQGKCLIGQQDFKGAISKYNNAIKLAGDYRYFYDDGNANMVIKRYEDAINAYTGAISSDSLNVKPDKFYRRGLCYLKNNDFAKSLPDFEAYSKLQVSANDTTFHSNYALAQLYNGDADGAFKNLDKFKGDAYNSFVFGCYYAKSGHFPEAINSFKVAFASGAVRSDELKMPEKTFLADLYKDKNAKRSYNDLKKQYIK